VARDPVRVPGVLGELPGQVELAGARGALVDLLQERDVGIVVIEDVPDPLGTEAPVNPDRTVDVGP